MAAVDAAHALIRLVATQFQCLPDQGRKVLAPLIVRADVAQTLIAHHRGGIHPVGIAGPGRHQAVGGKEHRRRNIFKFPLLALPRRAEVPRQLRILFQTRIPVCRKHLAVGIHVDPRSGGLLQQLAEILQIMTGDHYERPTLYIRIHPRGNRMAERFRIGAVQQRHTLKIHLTELHDESQPFLNAVLLPQSGQALIEPRADFCLFIAQIHGVVGVCRHAL